MIRVLFFSAILTLALPTLVAAQDAPTPAVGAEDQARAEAGMQALTAALDGLRPQADAIRADATLSDAVKHQRLVALLDQKAAEIDTFEAMVGQFTRAQLAQENATPEQIELGSEIIRQHLMAGIVDNFVAGRTLFGS